MWCFITSCSPCAESVRDNKPRWILVYKHNKGRTQGGYDKAVPSGREGQLPNKSMWFLKQSWNPGDETFPKPCPRRTFPGSLLAPQSALFLLRRGKWCWHDGAFAQPVSVERLRYHQAAAPESMHGWAAAFQMSSSTGWTQGSCLLTRAALPLPCSFVSSDEDPRGKVDLSLCEASQEH